MLPRAADDKSFTIADSKDAKEAARADSQSQDAKMISLLRSLQRCHWRLLWTTLPRQAQDKDVGGPGEKYLTITSITWELRLVFAEFTDTRSSKDVEETALYLTVQLGAALDDPNSGKSRNTRIFKAHHSVDYVHVIRLMVRQKSRKRGKDTT
jgi:hypothetical protein